MSIVIGIHAFFVIGFVAAAYAGVAKCRKPAKKAK